MNKYAPDFKTLETTFHISEDACKRIAQSFHEMGMSFGLIGELFGREVYGVENGKLVWSQKENVRWVKVKKRS